MRISIFGLGYVGAVSAGCLAERGHAVVGVDISHAKVGTLGAGKSPILEKGLDDLLARHVKTGRLRATTDAADAVANTDLSLVCVGTPSAPDGSPDLTAVVRVCEQIGRAIKAKRGPHTVAIRSTTLPASAEAEFLPALERESGRRLGEGLGFATHPEFLREGTAVHDFFHPPKTVIGTRDAATADLIKSLYDGIDAPMLVTSPAVAMTVKYADNAFHALKVTFANEIGRVCKKWGVDAQEVMELFCQDTKLNISKAYLRPAFAFGGSCLPKDVRALVREGEKSGAHLLLLGEILRSNEAHILEVVEQVRKAGAKRVGLFGITFKAGTDDLRESAAVSVARRLVRDGCEVVVHDPRVSVENLIGANKQFADEAIPSLAQMIRYSADDVIGADSVIVVDPDFDWAWAHGVLRESQTVIDVDGGGKALMAGDPRYVGICW
ncbi:MAG: nucleotide sugar dehydrogenase [Phycisphaerae bacterium]|nr:nucleotide sugar dehydrogenase [Tepidisphaeraceae bacterium]